MQNKKSRYRTKSQDRLEQQISDYRQNLKLLKASIYYFYRLRNEDKISDEILNNLTRYSCAVFINSQLESTIKKVVENNIAQFLDSELSLIDNKSDIDSLYSFEESSKMIDSLKKYYV
ncbi:MAG: hypothetical protein ACRC8K_26940 [Waterburya sp.]